MAAKDWHVSSVNSPLKMKKLGSEPVIFAPTANADTAEFLIIYLLYVMPDQNL